MYIKRFNELVIVTTAPYKRDNLDEWLDYREYKSLTTAAIPELWCRGNADPFGSADCSCDICNGQN